MRTSIWTRLLISALAGCTVAALAAPAFGDGGGVTLHRDGSKAVPFVAEVGDGGGASAGVPVLRRDGSKAVPFVAGSEPNTATAPSGFDWGDAGIGAAFALAMVGLGRALLVRNRHHRPERPVTTA
jgi:hypothetical protein